MDINKCGFCTDLKFDNQMTCWYCGYSGKAEDTCPKADAIEDQAQAQAHGEGRLKQDETL